jgi:hypothetical protein
MPDSVLAAIIAGTATLSASFLQFRSASLRDATRGQSSSTVRRKNRMQRLVLLVIIGAAAVSGFALSQWLNEGERTAQGVLQQELRARIAEVSRTATELEQTRAGARAEIESAVLRGIGTEGIAVTATVPECRPGITGGAAGAPSPALADAARSLPRPCTEAEASAVTLCVTIPANAAVTEVALFSRLADSDAPWSASRFLPGQQAGLARFAEKYSESAPEAGSRQVCQGFANWSADHARAVRVVVHYSL